MNNSEALTVFNLSDAASEDLVFERYEELIFEWKNEVLKINFSSEILEIKKKRLARMALAYQVLTTNREKSAQEELRDFAFSATDLTPKKLIFIYQETETAFRNLINRISNAAALLKVLDSFILFHKEWESKWHAFFSVLSTHSSLIELYADADVKISNGVDTIGLIRTAELLSNTVHFNEENIHFWQTNQVTKEALFTLYRESRRIQLALERRT